jgi:hypothetical protein
MASRNLGSVALAWVLAVAFLASCRTLKRELIPADQVVAGQGSATTRLQDAFAGEPFVKAHMADGSAYVLADGTFDQDAGVLTGSGVRHDPYRRTETVGAFRIPIDSVVVFETNRMETSGAASALTIVTGISLAVTGYCLANTKACFGSCPTFYGDTAHGPHLLAEGFSSSIAPSLERTDVDDLSGIAARDGTVTIEMRNEAFETHVVRSVRLLAVPSMGDTEVFAGPDGRFFSTTLVTYPTGCADERGSCLGSTAARDGIEWFSAADSTDLAGTEIVDLDFGETDSSSRYGVVVSARQTLLSTFVLYQALAWMGTDVGTWFARIENRDLAGSPLDLQTLFGAVEVMVPTADGEWSVAGAVTEVGPLATDTHVIPLPEGVPADRIRLRVRRGGWRIDQVALATLSEAPAVISIEPTSVSRDGLEDPDWTAALLDPQRTLVTMPGDRYRIRFRLPDPDAGYHVFLESRGYYLEWIREEWMRETDPQQVVRLMLDPAAMLKAMAPAFKQQESSMESVFWSSRYAY